MKWKSRLLNLAMLAIVQFPILMVLAIWYYPGGTIHSPEWESYSFSYNYFSDLGRTRTFDGTPNPYSHLFFKTSLTLVGLGMMAFFAVMPSLFRNTGSRGLALFAAFLGFASAFCYIGIGHVPWNESYWGHRYFVIIGFGQFLLMSVVLLSAILSEADYPRRYAVVLAVFCLIAFGQICIMLMGPRAFRSNDALYLQAVAQKVTVFAEIICMLYLTWGARQRVQTT